MRTLINILGLTIAFTFFCACEAKTNTKAATIQTKTDEKVSISLEIARTQEERALGFMNRTNIPDGTGMLFVFETEQVLRFWMKDTPTALSIAFIDKAGTIKELKNMKALSLETVSSSFSCLYALEVPLGWFERAGISVGDRLDPTCLQ